MSKKTEVRPQTSNINPFGLRMQPDLRERVEAAAAEAGRSLNAEIIARLEASFEPAATAPLDELEPMVSYAIRSSLEAIERRQAHSLKQLEQKLLNTVRYAMEAPGRRLQLDTLDKQDEQSVTNQVAEHLAGAPESLGRTSKKAK